jgi:hypothetical protein
VRSTLLLEFEVTVPAPRGWAMSATTTSFGPKLAPCGHTCGGEQYVTEDHVGLVTEELRYSCGCCISREEFHDGSCHRLVVHHNGRVLSDEELRGE